VGILFIAILQDTINTLLYDNSIDVVHRITGVL